MLRLDHVWREYQVGDGEVVALCDVSLRIDEGELVAIVGPSGSGKSTLLQILGLLDRPTRGSVELDGRELSDLNDAERTRLRLETLGFVFQRFHLLPDLTAIENVAVPLEAAGVPVGERFERAAWLLTAVGLVERLDFRPARLSGGQRQRVAIARALANDPRIVFADEPTGELHSEDKANVIELFRDLNRQGHAIVMVTHDTEVADVARRKIEIRDGRVRELGAPLDEQPRAVQATATDITPRAPAAPPARRPAPRRGRRTLLLAAGLVGLLALAGAGAVATGRVPGEPAPAPQAASPAAVAGLTARGEVRPVSRAQVGTLVGGTLQSIAVTVGQPVQDGQELARVRTATGTEVLVAPWRGTITDIPANIGDTVTPGSVIALVADLSRLQVETTDVDEFIVAQIRAGQAARLSFDAFDAREIRARVRSVSLQPRRTPEGDDHYPVVLDLEWTPPEIRPGMTARVAFHG